MDSRIGILIQEGKTVYYAFAHGYDNPETQGSLADVEAALGLRTPQQAPKARKTTVYREYIVTMITDEISEELPVDAKSHADAISRARSYYNMNEGRTRACDLLSRSFKARLAK